MPMQRRFSASAIVILMLLVVPTGAGCMQGANIPAEDPPVPPGTGPYIDHHIHRHGEALEEGYPIIAIDFPTYTFDNETRTLSGLLTFEVDQSLIAVYGSGLSLSGDAGIGAATGLSGVYSIPYEADDSLVIRNVTPNGTAWIEYQNTTITLAANETWENISVRVEEEPTYDGIETGRQGHLKITETDTITNYGLLEREEIENTTSLAAAPETVTPRKHV